MCWGGKPSLLTCNAGLKYDFKRKLCDVSSKVKCVTDALAEKPAPAPLKDNKDGVVSAAASQVASANNSGATQATPAEKEKEGKENNKKPKKSTETKQWNF